MYMCDTIRSRAPSEFYNYIAGVLQTDKNRYELRILALPITDLLIQAVSTLLQLTVYSI